MDGTVFFSFPHGALPFLSVSFTIISDDGKKASRIPLQQKNARAVKPGRCAFQLTLFFEELLLFAFTGGNLGGFRVYLSHFGSCTAKTVLAAAELAVIDDEVRDNADDEGEMTFDEFEKVAAKRVADVTLRMPQTRMELTTNRFLLLPRSTRWSIWRPETAMKP